MTAAAGNPMFELTKRAIDVAVSMLAVIMLLPVWFIIAIAIRLDSPGPALYSGLVAGKNGKPFRYYKFRTMYTNNDDTVHRQFLNGYVTADRPFTVEQSADGGKPVFKVVNDKRVTRVGRLLRPYGIDEIPQLLNVLTGDMSLVGPRPPVLYEYELYDEAKKARLSVKPGITGLAQARARGSASFSEMLRLDLDYIQHRSLLLDMRIMAETVVVLALRKGVAR